MNLGMQKRWLLKVGKIKASKGELEVGGHHSVKKVEGLRFGLWNIEYRKANSGVWRFGS